jgi:hypothetical protein
MSEKITNWWAKMSFWNKLRSILTSITAMTEVALFIQGSEPFWKVFSFVIGLVVILITHLIEDNNNDGLADIFQ